MKNAKVSLICTVKDEEKSIKELLESIRRQTLKPDEIIIVDGGSKDKTIELIKKFAKKNKRLKLIEAPGTNIAKGRNIAIKHAKNEIIACTDGGCILDDNWLKNLIESYKKSDADIVAGVFKPKWDSFFEFCVGEITCPDLNKLTDKWNPSSRSILFKKSAWKAVGGYPENLYTAEDTVFNQKLREMKFKYKLAKDAIVYWRMRKNLKSFFKQYYLYGLGDAKAKMFLKDFGKTMVITSFYLFTGLLSLGVFTQNIFLLTLLMSFFFCYFLVPGIKIFLKTWKIRGLIWGPLILLIKRISYIVGFHRGLL